MGIGIIVSCRNCSYNEEFLLGTGEATFWLLSEVMVSLNELEKEQLMKITQGSERTRFCSERAIYQCSECKTLTEKLLIKLNKNDKYIIAPMYCVKCRKPLVIIDNLDKIKDMSCPQCSEVTLKYVENKLWD